MWRAEQQDALFINRVKYCRETRSVEVADAPRIQAVLAEAEKTAQEMLKKLRVDACSGMPNHEA